MDPNEKIKKYKDQLNQVEVALKEHPDNADLVQMKKDLLELIEIAESLTKQSGSTGHLVPNDVQSKSLTQDTPSSSKKISTHSANVTKLLENVSQLPDWEYKDFMMDALDEDRPPELIEVLVKRYSNNKHSQTLKRKLPDDPITGNKKPKADAVIKLKDAPLICRGDLFDGFLFISVGLIKLKENADSESVPGVVAIINADQDLVFWSWIFWPEEEIEFTYPQTTGISRDNLKIGLPLDQVSSILNRLLTNSNAVIVGLKLRESLEGLKIIPHKTEDIGEYFKNDEGYVYPLDNLKRLLPTDEGVVHEEESFTKVLDNATIIGKVHHWMKSNQSEFPLFSQHPAFDIVKGKYDGMTDDDLKNIADEDLKDDSEWAEMRRSNLSKKQISWLRMKRNYLRLGRAHCVSEKRLGRKKPRRGRKRKPQPGPV